jgi:isoquinoline 1-oxidoreductase subunit beta
VPERPERGEAGGARVSRRQFIGYVIAAPTLVAAAELTAADLAVAAIPTTQAIDFFDSSDALKAAVAPTAHLISVIVNTDGTVAFALPRAEVGQGITTAIAMTIADELDVAVGAVRVTLADARPELLFNQVTGGSSTMHAMFTPVRVAAAIARGRLLAVAARLMGVAPARLAVREGIVSGPDGSTVTYGQLATRATASSTTAMAVSLKPASRFTVVGTPRRRIDALDIVTGRKRFAMDIAVPGAVPTMLCRAPTINGSVERVRNLAAVRAMPGITDVVVIAHSQFVPGGVAVCATTFGRCIDAIRALDVTWNPGPLAGTSEDDVLLKLKQAELPLPPAVPLAKSIEHRFTFSFRPEEALETNCAIADVRPDRADIWASTQSPIFVKEKIAVTLGLPVGRVTVHVAHGGGSFGRHQFADAAFEAAAVSKAIGKPAKLMWHRTDGFRHGRVHGMCISRVRATYLGQQVLAFDQRNTAVTLDASTGFGEALTAAVAQAPHGSAVFGQFAFAVTQSVPYNFGAVTQLLNQTYPISTFNTSSVRNVFSPDAVTARELTVDELAAKCEWIRIASAARLSVTAGYEPYSTRSHGSDAGAGRCAPPRRRASCSTRSTKASPHALSRSTARQRPPGAP